MKLKIEDELVGLAHGVRTAGDIGYRQHDVAERRAVQILQGRDELVRRGSAVRRKKLLDLLRQTLIENLLEVERRPEGLTDGGQQLSGQIVLAQELGPVRETIQSASDDVLLRWLMATFERLSSQRGSSISTASLR